jgi:hypothetical protein
MSSYLRDGELTGPHGAVCQIRIISLSPPVFYSTLVYMMTYTWFILAGSVYAQIFSAPPYSFASGKIGYIAGIGPLLGCTIALVSSG